MCAASCAGRPYGGDLALFLGWCGSSGRDLNEPLRSLGSFVAWLRTTPVERKGSGPARSGAADASSASSLWCASSRNTPSRRASSTRRCSPPSTRSRTTATCGRSCGPRAEVSATSLARGTASASSHAGHPPPGPSGGGEGALAGSPQLAGPFRRRAALLLRPPGRGGPWTAPGEVGNRRGGRSTTRPGCHVPEFPTGGSVRRHRSGELRFLLPQNRA